MNRLCALALKNVRMGGAFSKSQIHLSKMKSKNVIISVCFLVNCMRAFALANFDHVFLNVFWDDFLFVKLVDYDFTRTYKYTKRYENIK